MVIGRHPLSGSGWTVTGHGLSKAIGLASAVTLARLLVPTDFGVFALALLVLTSLSAVTQLGLGGAVVVMSGRASTLEATLGALLLGGVAGTALLLPLAGPIARLFDSATLEPVLRALSPTLIIGGVATFYEALILRELDFRARFATLIVQSGSSAAVAIGAAALGLGVWSLVAGQLVGTSAYAAATLCRAPYRVRPRLARGPIRDAFRFGRGFMAHRVIEHAQHNLDLAAVGYVIGSTGAGFYSLAYRLADLPYQVFTEQVANTAFPEVAKRQRERTGVSDLALEFLSITTFFVFPMAVMLSAAADPLVGAVFGSKWQAVAGPLAILGLWAAMTQPEAALGWILNAAGRAGVNAKISATAAVTMVPLLLLGAHRWGMDGVAWAMVLGALGTGAAVMGYAHRKVAIPLSRQLTAMSGPALGAVVAWMSTRAAVEVVAGPDSARLAAGLLIGLASYLGTLRLVDPSTINRSWQFARDSLISLRESGTFPGGHA